MYLTTKPNNCKCGGGDPKKKRGTAAFKTGWTFKCDKCGRASYGSNQKIACLLWNNVVSQRRAN